MSKILQRVSFFVQVIHRLLWCVQGNLPSGFIITIDQCGTVPLDAELDQIFDQYSTSNSSVADSTSLDDSNSAATSTPVVAEFTLRPFMETFFLDHGVRPTASLLEALTDSTSKYAPIQPATFNILRLDYL